MVMMLEVRLKIISVRGLSSCLCIVSHVIVFKRGGAVHINIP